MAGLRRRPRYRFLHPRPNRARQLRQNRNHREHMANTLTSGAHIGDLPRPEKNYINAEKGVWSWMTTIDHKRIGVMYLVGILSAFMVGGIFALFVRLSLL